MPHLSERSYAKLNQCHPDLVDICEQLIRYFDFTVITGHRNEQEQNRMKSEGKSQLSYPDSKHNKTPSLAVDIAPYPIDWSDRERFTLMAGMFIAIAAMKGIQVRWGGDWNRNTEVNDNKFDDLPHFELVGYDDN